ncbi:MAG: O-antigen ligase domain-containing protein [Bacteroidota bacterium]
MSILDLNKRETFGEWLRRNIVIEKLNNPLGYAMCICIAVLFTLVTTQLGMIMGAGLLAAVIGIPMVLLCIFNLPFGIIVMLSSGVLISLAGKYTGAPIGTALDGLLFAMGFGVIVQVGRDRQFDFIKHPISVFILVWIYYNILQVLNPVAGSRMAWIYTVRTLALMLMLYYIACYAFKDLKTIKFILKAILFWAFASALYAMKQEFIGFNDAELQWLYADEKRFQLIVQWDRMRVFSFYSDPTTFGILMAYMGVLCMVLIIGPYKNWQRVILGIGAVMMMMAMAFAGSRTPFVLVPLGLLFFALLTLNRKTLIITGVLMLLGTGMVMKSTSNAVVWRIQSAFRPTEDASVQVRLDNQRLIQPYIQTHPIGAGLGSTGMWGARFTPDSWLASFAHDSLYVRIAVEAGYIGLLIYMAMLFVALKTGIYYFFRCRDPEIKNLYLGITVAVFILVVASYPQEAITLLPTSIIFYLMLAMLVRLKDFDRLPAAEAVQEVE